MFLNTIPSVKSINLSNLLDNLLLNKYPEIKIPNNYKNDIEDNYFVLSVFDKFFDILSGFEHNKIFSMTIYSDQSEKYYGRSLYRADNKETLLMLQEMSVLCYYFQTIFTEKKKPFYNIQKGCSKYDILLKNDYDIHNENDMKHLMNYFWKYEISIRIHQEK